MLIRFQGFIIIIVKSFDTKYDLIMKDTLLLPKNRFIWALLAFQGGYINIGGLLTIHLFVSHITGFSAHFSLAFKEYNFFKSFYFLLVPFFFLMGSFVSALFTDLRKNKNLQPVYLYIMLMLSLIFLAVSLFGKMGFFGVFGEPFENFRDFVLLSLLAFSCGSQNAIFTHYSKSIIRTTHLTGITTDLGIGLSKYFFSSDFNEGKLNRIRIELILSFILGSLIGSYTFPSYQFLAFLLPSILSLIIGIRLFSTRLSTRTP